MKSNSSIRLAKLSLVAALFGLVAASSLPSYAGSFAQNHPRRAQVMRRDNRLNSRINANRGNLGGHYGQLKSADQAIRNQQRADAKTDGGHITRAQKQQLNQQENQLSRQIRQDK